MVPFLLIALGSLFLCVAVYVVVRRQRHGGLAGGLVTTYPRRTEANKASDRILTAEEVASHNKPEDLWLIINNKVYNFTEYLPLHPGGEAILKNAGRDSTTGFSGPQHPTRVWDMVSQYSQNRST